MSDMIPVFIAGTGRSGTTVLKQVLARHSRIVALANELRVIVDPGGVLDLISALSDRWSPWKADTAIFRFRDMLLACGRSSSAGLLRLERFSRKALGTAGLAPRPYGGMGLAHQFGYDYYHKRLQQLVEDLSFHVTRGNWLGSPFPAAGVIFESEPKPRGDIEQILRAFIGDLYLRLAREGSSHWVEDSPFNLLYAAELHRLFPSMRLVHIFRDPRDVLASHMQFGWGGDSLDATARRLAGIYRRWSQIRGILPASSFLEVSLEALSAHPEDGLREICGFIGLDFEESLMAIPLDKVHRGRWQQEIPNWRGSVPERHLGKYVLEYGYSSSET